SAAGERLSPQAQRAVNIVGAGLAGSLLALLLARRGLAVTLHERRPDPRQTQPERGRSINLALAARGMLALERAGVMDRVRPLLIPMRGRMVHELSGRTALQPYGQREHEVIWSVGRAALNRVLIEEAARHAGVSVRFNQLCLGAEVGRDRLRFRDEASGALHESALTPTIAADGAGSVVRASLAALARPPAVAEFFDRQFADVVPLMPDLLAEFASHPQGQLGTVHASAWQVAGRVLLLGDAAHAIVPFHGQGMNAAFEDCAVLDALLERQADWPTVFEQFEQSRRPNAAAIAQMALENYTEMRDAVLD